MVKSTPDRLPKASLTLENSWIEDGHSFVRWSAASQSLLRSVKNRLDAELKTFLSRRCAHIKGHGGVKGSVRYAQALSNRYRYVARFDIRAYYESINHTLLLRQLKSSGLNAVLSAAVRDYLGLPDRRRSGCGMVAGGAISPVLGAVYLTPLDREMEAFKGRLGIRYQRYMDDFLIFAPTRHKLKAALRGMYAVLSRLKLTAHPGKRYIGTTKKGFDFLGYRIHPNRLLRASKQSLDRLVERSRRLYEQGGDQPRLRQYVQRWYSWLLGGLRGRVSKRGRFNRVWKFVLKRLNIIGCQNQLPLVVQGS